MSYFAISCLLTSFASFVGGFFVLYKDYKSKINISWFFVSIFIGIWSFSLHGIVSANNFRDAFIYQYILDLAGIFIPIFYFIFIVNLLKLRKKKKNFIKFFFFLGIIIAIFSFTTLFKKGMIFNFYGFNYWVDSGPFYFIFPLFYIFLVFYSFFLLFINYKKLHGAKKSQIKYIFMAGAVGFLGAATNFFPQIINFYPIGNYFVILYVFVVAYAVIRYRLMGISIIASKIYIYIALALFSFFFFHVVAYVDNKYLGGFYSAEALITGLFFAIIFAIFFLPLIKYIQKTSDYFFFRGYNPKTILKDLIVKLNNAIKLSEVLQILVKEFKNVLEVNKIDVLIFNDNNRKGKKNCCVAGRCDFKRVNLRYGGTIYKAITKNAEIIVRDEIKVENKNKELIKRMDKYNIKILVPLMFHSKAVGAILLGERKLRDAYTKEGIEFLEIISLQAAIAIKNAQLYAEVKDFNKNLNKKVKEQTNEILERTKKLEKLLEMRGEFLNIASHQLRTPVSIIKGALSMIIEKPFLNKKNKIFFDMAFQKSIKLGEIIDSILKASEMDSDKFELKIEPIQLELIVEEAYNDKIFNAKEKGLEFVFNKPKDKLKKVMADDRYLKYVIINLINNALQYTKKGKITISIFKKNKYAVVEVADTGIGISKNDFSKLFKKFGRAENAINIYANGSGLGLFIIKKIVDSYNKAEIKIKSSEINKGTVFSLKLPFTK